MQVSIKRRVNKDHIESARLIGKVLLSSGHVQLHFFAGIKHLMLDMHIADTTESGELMTKISVGLAAVSAVLTGIWIW